MATRSSSAPASFPRRKQALATLTVLSLDFIPCVICRSDFATPKIYVHLLLSRVQVHVYSTRALFYGLISRHGKYLRSTKLLKSPSPPRRHSRGWTYVNTSLAYLAEYFDHGLVRLAVLRRRRHAQLDGLVRDGGDPLARSASARPHVAAQLQDLRRRGFRLSD